MISPGTGDFFSVPDSIEIEAEISDNENIQWIQVNLINNNQQPVSQTLTISDVNKKSYHLKAKYPLTDILLESGEYYMQVRVSDGTNTKNGQVKIYVDEAGKKLQYFLVVTKSNPNESSMYYLDTSWNKNYIFSEATDYLNSVFLSRSQLFILGGGSVYDIKAFEAEKFQHIWNIPVVANPPQPYFTEVAAGEKETLVGFYNGEIGSYNQAGNRTNTYESPTGLHPYKLCTTDDFLIAAQRNIPNNQRYISIYHKPAGGTYLKQHITFNVQDFFVAQGNELIVMGNENNGAGIWQFDLVNQTLWDAKDFDESIIKASCQVSANSYLISGNSNTYWYQASTNSLTSWENNLSADQLYYEEQTNSVIAITNKSILFYDFPISQLEKQISFQEEILAVHPVYNK